MVNRLKTSVARYLVFVKGKWEDRGLVLVAADVSLCRQLLEGQNKDYICLRNGKYDKDKPHGVMVLVSPPIRT